jgi:hypothetical protein
MAFLRREALSVYADFRLMQYYDYMGQEGLPKGPLKRVLYLRSQALSFQTLFLFSPRM